MLGSTQLNDFTKRHLVELIGIDKQALDTLYPPPVPITWRAHMVHILAKCCRHPGTIAGAIVLLANKLFAVAALHTSICLGSYIIAVMLVSAAYHRGLIKQKHLNKIAECLMFPVKQYTTFVTNFNERFQLASARNETLNALATVVEAIGIDRLQQGPYIVANNPGEMQHDNAVRYRRGIYQGQPFIDVHFTGLMPTNHCTLRVIRSTNRKNEWTGYHLFDLSSFKRIDSSQQWFAKHPSQLKREMAKIKRLITTPRTSIERSFAISLPPTLEAQIDPSRQILEVFTLVTPANPEEMQLYKSEAQAHGLFPHAEWLQS